MVLSLKRCIAQWQQVDEKRDLLNPETAHILDQIRNVYLPEIVEQYRVAEAQGHAGKLLDGELTAAQVCQQNIHMIEGKLTNIADQQEQASGDSIIVQRNFLMQRLEVKELPEVSAADKFAPAALPEPKKDKPIYQPGDRVEIDLVRMVDEWDGGLSNFCSHWNWDVGYEYKWGKPLTGTIRCLSDEQFDSRSVNYDIDIENHGLVVGFEDDYLTPMQDKYLAKDVYISDQGRLLLSPTKNASTGQEPNPQNVAYSLSRRRESGQSRARAVEGLGYEYRISPVQVGNILVQYAKMNGGEALQRAYEGTLHKQNIHTFSKTPSKLTERNKQVIRAVKAEIKNGKSEAVAINRVARSEGMTPSAVRYHLKRAGHQNHTNANSESLKKLQQKQEVIELKLGTLEALNKNAETRSYVSTRGIERMRARYEAELKRIKAEQSAHSQASDDYI
jgi:hypothetical protein